MPIGKNKCYWVTWNYCKKTGLGFVGGFFGAERGWFLFFFLKTAEGILLGSRYVLFPQSRPEWKELLYFAMFLDKLKLYSWLECTTWEVYSVENICLRPVHPQHILWLYYCVQISVWNLLGVLFIYYTVVVGKQGRVTLPRNIRAVASTTERTQF